MHLHVLKGCAPAPLANYLKALGILRLVGEQADPAARGWWDGERFCLLSKLSKEELETFFLESYEPTPLVAPWNGGSGFYAKDNRKAIRGLEDSTASRFSAFREAIACGHASQQGLKTKPDQKQKPRMFRFCVQSWRGKHREWLDAAVVFDEVGKPSYPSLLGTGGNDGRLDFTNNFMQRLMTLFDLTSVNGEPRNAATSLLGNAIWSKSTNYLDSAAIGQYHPGAAGGANSSTGFGDGNLVNPWDFVLMMEGAILFTSRATRQLNPNAFSQASAPFSLRPQAAGFASSGSEKSQRGEQWMPLWRNPAMLQDVAALLGEGRAQLGRQTVNRPVDMARAISRLGVARGVDAFVRYGYLERNGQSTLAVPLGRVQVRNHPRSHLIDDIAAWMDRIGRRSRDKNAPARLAHAERRLADVVFAALTHDPTPERWQAVLLAAAAIESLQAAGTGIDAGPIPTLRPEWVSAAADGSAEFRLALAIGSAAAAYSRDGRPVDPVRHHVLPLERGARRFKTSDKKLANDPRVVVSGRDPLRDLAAVVDRRLIEAAQDGQRRSRLVPAAGCGARLADLARFMSGVVDLERLLGLARAFMAIKWDQWSHDLLSRTTECLELPDDCWMAIRLCCLPWPLARHQDIPAEDRIVRLLVSGDATRAIEIARHRLRSAGIRLPLYAGTSNPHTSLRWAAALAFPIHRSTAARAATILDPSMKGLLHG